MNTKIKRLTDIKSAQSFIDAGLGFHKACALVHKLIIESRQSEPGLIRPSKPRLISQTPSDEEIKKYQEATELYNTAIKQHNSARDKTDVISRKVWDIIEEMMKQEAGFYDIPEKYQMKAYRFAYDYGHSSGYPEIYCYLCDIVEIFS